MGLAAAAQAETAFAHIGDRVTAMLFGERPVARAGVAAEVGYRNRWALEQRGPVSANLGRGAGRRNGQQHVEQGLAGGRCAPSIESSRRLEMAPPFGEILSA